MRWRVVQQVTLLTFREFLRTPAALFWTYGFPLVMALTLGMAFRSSKPLPLQVAVVEGDFAAAQVEALDRNPRLAAVLLPREAAQARFERGRCLLVVARGPAGPTIELDPTRPESELARLHVERALAGAPPRAVETIDVVRPGSRYIDWLIPGLIGLNLLGSGLWGVGFNLVQMRVKNVLRRLHVTPMRRSEFLVAFLLSRLSLVLPESAVILLFGRFVFGTPIEGSLVWILVIILLGSMAFTGLGLLLASRARTIETVSGLMNLTMLPMWLLGGSFFDTDRFPDYVQPVVDALPISHFNRALREVMTHGGGIAEVGGEVLFLGVFGVVTLGLAVRVFRWS